MSKIFLEILDTERQAVFNKLSIFKQDGYLAGGTALALQIKHRRSVDFDIFVNKSITNALRRKIEGAFGRQTLYVNTGDQISFAVNAIEITFVWYYYPLLYKPVFTSSIPIASVADIAADKAHTVGRRAVWRDYVDLYTFLKRNLFTLKDIIELARRKFQGDFIETQFLEQLAYFEDIAVKPIEFLDSPVSNDQIQSFLSQQVEEYLRQILPH